LAYSRLSTHAKLCAYLILLQVIAIFNIWKLSINFNTALIIISLLSRLNETEQDFVAEKRFWFVEHQPTKSTQPSTLRGAVKRVSAFWLSNNKWRWWVWRMAAYRKTRTPSRLAWSEGWQPTGAKLHSSDEPSELSK